MDSPRFPAPLRFAGRKFYRLGELRRYEAEIAGHPPPEGAPDDETLLNSRQVRDRYGGVSDMWLWRRQKEADAAGAAA